MRGREKIFVMVVVKGFIVSITVAYLAEEIGLLVDNILANANISFMTDDIYTAFGNEVRVKLIHCLSQKSKSVTELIETCSLSQSAVSQHLRKLKEAGVVKTDKKGKTVWYSLRYKKAADISALLLSLQKEVL